MKIEDTYRKIKIVIRFHAADGGTVAVQRPNGNVLMTDFAVVTSEHGYMTVTFDGNPEFIRQVPKTVVHLAKHHILDRWAISRK